MIATEHLEVLSGAVGALGLAQHEPVDVDGVAPSVTLFPGDGASLSRTLAAVARCGLSVLVRGGGNRLGVGNVPARADAFLSSQRMAGIVDFDVHDGVCRLRAGTELAAARAEIGEGGWELPLEPLGKHATVGGCLAAAVCGPRAQGYGQPRDVLLGLEVCLASGERTRCGGRVVKNVTGYDLNKLYSGAYGSLGVIESAWLRLKPRPQRCESHSRRFDDLGDASRIAIEASRRTTCRVAALSWPAGGPETGFRVVVEWAGDAPSVDLDAAWFADAAGSGPADAAAVDEVRDLQHDLPGTLRFRLGVLPTGLPAAIAALRDAGSCGLVYPGLGVLHAGFALDDGSDARAADEIFNEVSRIAAGEFLCESAPARMKSGRDVFGVKPELLPIFRNLKQRFDPESILNPGRFAGGL